MDGAGTPRAAVDPQALLAEAGWVERLARRMVRDDAAARDLVQDTWLAALQSPPAADGRLRPWLARVLLNFARQKKRGDDRRVRRENAAARPERLPPVSEASERIEAQRALADALAELSEPLQTTVVLRYFDGLSPSEIAKRQGVPPGTVRWRLHRAHEELREKLGRRSGGEGGQWALALLPLLRRPPLGSIAAQLAAGSTAAIVEGVVMMNTVTKVGIAAALVVTASVGVWIQSGNPREARGDAVAAEPAPASPALEAPAAEEPARPLSTAAPVEQREQAGASVPATASAAPAALAPDDARVEVRFVDRLDRPIEGVKIALLSFTELPPGTSGADGRARIDVELPKPTISSDVLATRAGLATHFASVELRRGKTSYLGDVRLEPAGSVAGRVLGPDGGPAAGAEVKITSPEMTRGIEDARRLGPWSDESVPAGVVLADGSFRIDGVRVGAVRVWAGGEDTRWSFTDPVEVPENGVRDGIELKLQELEPEDWIAGIVLSPDGEPVADADVHYLGKSGGSSWMGNFPAKRDGRFRHRVQVRGTYDLQAHDPDSRWPDASAIDVLPGTHDLVLQFPKARWIQVSVRARDGGVLPEFAATVLSADKKRTLRLGKLEAHDQGKVALLVPAEAFVVDVRARGHGNAVLGPWTPDVAPETAACTLDALPGVRGRVMAGETPVAAARVELHEVAGMRTKIERNGFPSRLHPEPEDTTTTDSQGYFQLDPSRPGGADAQRFYQRDAKEAGTFAILCEADGWALSEVTPLEVDPAVGVDGIEIGLVKGGAIEGKVLVAPGKDPAGVVVGVDRTDGKPRTQRVGPDGRFRFEHLTPGRYRVSREDSEWTGTNQSTSWSNGNEIRAEFPTNCTIDDGKTTRFDLDLRDDGPCVLAASVTVNGAPATGWTGSLWLTGRSTALKVPGGAVDALGRLRIEATEPGPHRLRLEPPAESGGGASFEVQVEIRRGETGLPVDLRVGAVRGRCAAKPAEASLSYLGDSGGPVLCNATVRIDAGGRFEMPFVLAGPGRIGRNEVHESGTTVGPVAEAKVDVPMGGSVEVDVP